MELSRELIGTILVEKGCTSDITLSCPVTENTSKGRG
jgi:hypothetical protein